MGHTDWDFGSPFDPSSPTKGGFLGWMPFEKFLKAFPGVREFERGQEGALKVRNSLRGPIALFMAIPYHTHDERGTSHKI